MQLNFTRPSPAKHSETQSTHTYPDMPAPNLDACCCDWFWRLGHSKRLAYTEIGVEM